jgi:hypothetical protein
MHLDRSDKELPPSPEEQKDVSCGTPEDKLRLLLMSFLVSGGQLSSADLDECCAALSSTVLLFQDVSTVVIVIN